MPKRESKTEITYVGIDPGWTGGISSLTGGEVFSTAMPKTESDIWYAIDDAMGSRDCIVVIEKVWAMPKQGVSSMFKFGWSYGFLRACLIASGTPFVESTPLTWMNGLGIKKKQKNETRTQWKNRLRGIAQQWFPGVPISRDAADSLLIAEYCRRKEQGKL